MNNAKNMAIIAILSAFLLTACSGPAPEQKAALDLGKIKTEIQAMEDAYATAEQAKDAAGVAAYYAEDAVSYNRNEEPTRGKAAIQERIAKRIASDTTGNKSTYAVVDLYAEGNQVVEIGSFTQTNPAGAVSDKGFYMSYFEKRDGKYQCVRDMSVTTTPVKQ